MTQAQTAKLAMKAAFPDRQKSHHEIAKWLQARDDHVGYDIAGVYSLPCVLYYPDNSVVIVSRDAIHTAQLG
jgi:mRNA-degrading endonuclease YafQ of YafQ-DinJ toxin-antitoxin module